MTTRWQFRSGDFEGLRATRSAALAVLRDHGDAASDFDACAVVLSELLSNAALHAPPGSIGVCLEWSRSSPIFTVHDSGPGFELNIALPSPLREGGRGLFLVAQLAEAPHVRADETGCHVSVALPVTRRNARNG